jgi:hypothetical protein
MTIRLEWRNAMILQAKTIVMAIAKKRPKTPMFAT